MSMEREAKLLTAAKVAALCEVDLKTIHNWADRGSLPHFRTPGRHLRFRAIDVATFLRALGYAVPRDFVASVGKSVLVVGAKDATQFVGKAMGEAASIRVVGDLYDALLRLGEETTTAIVLDSSVVEAHGETLERVVLALKRAGSTVVIALGDDLHELGQRAPILFVPLGDSKMLRAAIDGAVSERAEVEAGAVPEPAKPRTRMARTQGKPVP